MKKTQISILVVVAILVTFSVNCWAADATFIPNFPKADEHVLLVPTSHVRSDNDNVIPVMVNYNKAVMLDRANRDHLIIIVRKISGKFSPVVSGDPLAKGHSVEVAAISVQSLMTAGTPAATTNFYMGKVRFAKKGYDVDFSTLTWHPSGNGCKSQIRKALSSASGLLKGEADAAAAVLAFGDK